MMIRLQMKERDDVLIFHPEMNIHSSSGVLFSRASHDKCASESYRFVWNRLKLVSYGRLLLVFLEMLLYEKETSAFVLHGRITSNAFGTT